MASTVGTASPPEPIAVAEIALDRLPPTLRLIARAIGPAAAFRLVQERGGTYLCVPKDPGQPGARALAGLLGESAMRALVDAFPAETLQLPKDDKLVQQVRHRLVVETRFQPGSTLAQTARATGYSMRQVINICNAARERGQLPPEAAAAAAADAAIAAAQLDLFDPEPATAGASAGEIGPGTVR